MLDSRIYAPLSQGADSGSESEGNSERLVYGAKYLQQIHNHTHHNNQINHKQNKSNSNHIQISNYPNRMMEDLNCNSSSFSREGDDGHQTDADNVAILCTETKNDRMSPIRKCCFIISILVCIMTVVIFLWFIPCSEENTCPAPVDRIKTHNWLNTYDKFELKGTVNVANGIKTWEKNLIFMYRADKFFPEFQPNNHKRNGIISLIGNSGKIAWYNEMENEPIAIDCTLIDVNKNGKPDCLVVDEYGQVGSFDPVWGLWLWNFKNNLTTEKIDVLNFPVILPDLDGDTIKELLITTSSTVNGKNENFLRILSGRIGQPLAQGYSVKDCTKIRKFKLEKETISFICSKNDTEIQRLITLTELYALITNNQLAHNLTHMPEMPQHKIYGQRKDTLAQRNIYLNNGKELIIENQGICPDNCNMTVTWGEQRNGKKHIIGFINGSRMYGMVPALWSFKKTDGKNLSGFVMKFWEWSDQDTNHTKNSNSDGIPYTNRHKRDENNIEDDKSTQQPTSSATTFFADDYNIFEHLIKKRKSFTISEKTDADDDNVRSERSIANMTKQKTTINGFLNYKMRIIKEKVVLIIFNSADTRIENTSQSNIIQFCRNEKEDVICQPDLNYQENSLLIADLDGSQELISFYSTFTYKNEDRKDWILKTYVQLLRLESELPILYEDIKHD